MADVWDESVWGDDFEEPEEYEPSKERIVFLIDASPAMLEPCEVDEEGKEEEEKDFAGLSWLEAAAKVALHIMKQKIISAAGDEMAVLLYNAAAAKSAEVASDFEGCYLLQPLEQPGAESVRQLEDFSLSFFEKNVGSKEDAQCLISAFWMARHMCSSMKGPKATHRLLVFTRTELPFQRYDKGHDPSHRWRQLEGHLRTLRDAGTLVELYPMAPPAAAFDLQPFWRSVLLFLRGQATAGGGEGEEVAEEAQQVFRLRDLFTVVRSKAHKRRAVGSILWRLGKGLELAVKLYQMVQRQRIPPALKISGRTGHEVKAATAQIDKYTGEALEKDQILHYYFKKGNRYPKVYITPEETRQIKGVGQRGMTLLGFKPISCLKEHHQTRNSTFIYPDEKEVAGSATCFIALWDVMRETGTMAVCRVAPTKARTPTLVALLPQEETQYDDGSQATPPGMHLIYLPFMDDIRHPETSADFVGAVRHAPSESQVAAAEVLILELQLPAFDCGSVLNPALQRHYEVLESLAQGMEPCLVEDSSIGDPTLPGWEEEAGEGADDEEVAEVAARMQAILGFKEACGLTDDEPKKAGTKRAAAAPVDADAVAALGVEAKAAAGTLKSLTLDQLKMWLRSRGLTVGGKKDELIARIQNKLGA